MYNDNIYLLDIVSFFNRLILFRLSILFTKRDFRFRYIIITSKLYKIYDARDWYVWGGSLHQCQE